MVSDITTLKVDGCIAKSMQYTYSIQIVTTETQQNTLFICLKFSFREVFFDRLLLYEIYRGTLNSSQGPSGEQWQSKLVCKIATESNSGTTMQGARNSSAQKGLREAV